MARWLIVPNPTTIPGQLGFRKTRINERRNQRKSPPTTAVGLKHWLHVLSATPEVWKSSLVTN